MQEADLLYSGLIATALMLSVWTGALLATACVFFAPVVFDARTRRTASHKS